MTNDPQRTPQTDQKDKQGKPRQNKSRSRWIGPILVGAVAFAAVGTALTMFQGMTQSGAPMRSDKIADLTSIDAGLQSSGSIEGVVPITFGDGKVDLVYAGAPECSHCQAFMKDGYEDLVSYAEDKKLDLVYMPMALSGLGVAIAAVEKCALPDATVPASEMVKVAYGAVEGIQEAAGKANALVKEEGGAEKADKILTDAMSSLHHSFSASSDFNEACYQDASGTAAETMGTFSETFGLTATPSFYFMTARGDVMRTVGAPDLEALDAARQ